MKKVFCLFALVLVAFSFASCNKAKEGLIHEGEFVVGLECCYQPFNWTETVKTDTNVAIEGLPGAYADGYDIQVAKVIASILGLTLKVKAIEWKGLIPALKNGSIDAIIAGMSPTEERKKSIAFTDKYYESQHVLLVKANSDLASATKLSDFTGKVVAGQLGTLFADLEDQAVQKVQAVAGVKKDTVNEILLDMKNGITDAQVLELPVAKGIVAQDSSFTYVTFAEGNGFTVLEEDKVVSIGVRKGFSYLDEINEALSKITPEMRENLMDAAVLANLVE